MKTSRRAKKTRTEQASWYDQPLYYDIAFHSETPREADFLQAAFAKYARGPVERVLEPACGSGRLVAEMAARGYRVSAFDLCAPQLRFLRKRLARRRLQADVFQADMADFGLREPVDAAFCTFGSFRHLVTEYAARRHLECVARAVRPGGLYILGFHLVPLDAEESCVERWTERRGRTQVTVTLRVVAADRRRRVEMMRVCTLVREGEKVKRFRDEFPMRLYTARQFRRLLDRVPHWELCDVFDFWYEIDGPVALDDELSDAVFVLRRREGP